mmetsp:Transcript_56215/g.122944  ORF Transcript_56215/g.122944 Transcript_56215/m.122944 type:complete len:216 (-) Transcript_56215:465-1112(-)
MASCLLRKLRLHRGRNVRMRTAPRTAAGGFRMRCQNAVQEHGSAGEYCSAHERKHSHQPAELQGEAAPITFIDAAEVLLYFLRHQIGGGEVTLDHIVGMELVILFTTEKRVFHGIIDVDHKFAFRITDRSTLQPHAVGICSLNNGPQLLIVHTPRKSNDIPIFGSPVLGIKPLPATIGKSLEAMLEVRLRQGSYLRLSTPPTNIIQLDGTGFSMA